MHAPPAQLQKKRGGLGRFGFVETQTHNLWQGYHARLFKSRKSGVAGLCPRSEYYTNISIFSKPSAGRCVLAFLITRSPDPYPPGYLFIAIHSHSSPGIGI